MRLLHRKPTVPDLRELPDAEWRIAASLGVEGDPRAIPALLNAMHGYDEDRTDQAAGWIAAMPRGAAADALAKALREPRRYNQQLVGGLLRKLAPESVPCLLEAMGHRKSQGEAMRVLAALKEPRAVAPIIKRATSGRISQRETALGALGQYGSVDGFDTALAALHSRSRRMRSRAVYTLGHIGDRRAVEPLIAALRDRSEDVRGSAIYVLGKLGVVEPLIAALADRRDGVRESAVLALAERKDERAVDGLLEVMKADATQGYAGLSYSAAKAVSACGQAGVSALMSAAHDSDPRVRHFAFVGLTCDGATEPIRDNAVIRLLGEGVSDSDKEASHAAATALKPYKNRLAADVLLPHLDDPRPHVRDAAIWGIWAHADKDVVEKLSALMLSDPDNEVRKDAAWGLGVSRCRRAERPLLEAIAAESDEAVRETARKSLHWVRVGH